MADLVLGSVVDSILGHAASLAAQETQLAWGVKGELKKLEKTASAIAALLREADKGWVDSEVVKDWLKKLKDVVYDADDLLDDYSTEALRRRRVAGRRKRILNEVRVFFSPSNQIVYTCKMAHRVMEIRGNIDNIMNDKGRFQLEGVSGSCPRSFVENPVSRETYPFKSQPYVIGRDNDKKEVMEFLLDRNHEENVSILAVVGLGGQGKTTLAGLIFNDERAKENFPLMFWVCLLTNFIAEDILRKMLRKWTPKKELANLDMNELQEKLEKELGGKRFLLVLDDVWDVNPHEWWKLQKFLMIGTKGSKILVTSRTHLVASIMTKNIYELRGLTEPDSFSLLMQMARKEEHEWKSQNLEMIGKEIVKKCAGVPFAIMTIAGLLLSSRNTEEDWLNFKNNDLSRIDQEERDILPSLRLSYDYLPPRLKECFAYCSLFPKDCEIELSELINLWMAQGLIKSSDNRKMPEEVGHDYFMGLLTRSFFQDTKEDMYGNIVRFKMHDLMHDLAQLVAGNSCDSINTAVERKIPEGARHVSIFNLGDDGLKGFERNGRLRSLLFIIEKTIGVDINVSCFTNLRALRLPAVNAEEVSDSIGKLKHLRSLDLSRSRSLRSLPSSISGLCNLETLNLSDCSELERLPTSLTKLVNLRHLDMRRCGSLTHLPRGIGRLTDLRTLNLFIVGEKRNSDTARLNELSELTELRKKLTIKGLERLKCCSDELDASFSMEKAALQSLELEWTYGEDKFRANHEEILQRFHPHSDLKGLRIQGYGGNRLPCWVSQLHGLVKVTIYGCQQCKHLPPVDHLHFLKELRLIKLGNLEFIELSDSGTTESLFPSLEQLWLINLFEFSGWERRRNKNELEGGVRVDEDDSSLTLIPAFPDRINIRIRCCPRFSYLHGQQLSLTGTPNKLLQQWLRNSTLQSRTALPIPSVTMMTSTSSLFLAAPTALKIAKMEDVEHLPMELFQSLPSLQSLKIKHCPCLKSLSMREILRCLTALETLRILECSELDLSIDNHVDDDSGEGMLDLPMQGHSKVRCLTITRIQKMGSLPEWLRCFPNLEDLKIGSQVCESEDQKGMTSSQFSGPTKLRVLEFDYDKQMETLPWWIQHLANLEELRLIGCSNMKTLPEWFPQHTSLKHLKVWWCGEELSRRCDRNTGEDWPKISHIQDVDVR